MTDLDEKGEKTRWFIGWHPKEDSMPHLIMQHSKRKPEFEYYEYVSIKQLEHLQATYDELQCKGLKAVLVQVVENKKLQAENKRLKKENPNFLREVSSEWETTMNDDSVTCHDRMVGGVLCRWWGDGETPEGVAVIDSACEALEEQNDHRDKKHKE